MAAAITLEHVSKRYRLYHERNQSVKAAILRRGRARYEEFQAVDDVSAEIGAGESFAFIGENGSGKSTLLKCIAKILRPETGTIEVEGKLSALLELGAGFHPELTGRENVYLNGSILGMRKRELDAIFDDIVAFAGLERFIDSPVKNYSSGMYVRLGFSVAINVDPDILLVDEVLAVGDEAFQRKCSEKFAELREAGKTIVMVSHGLDLVRSMCDRAIWLDHGQVRAIGAAGDVVDSYLVGVHNLRAPGDGSWQYGSGEARIERVELLDVEGTSVGVVRTGDPATLRLHFAADTAIERPLVSFAITTVDGSVVTNPNSHEAGFDLPTMDGQGTLDIVFDALPLLPGTYDVSTAITDDTMLHDIHHHRRALRFDVDAGTPHESFGGVVTLGGRWRRGEQ